MTESDVKDALAFFNCAKFFDGLEDATRRDAAFRNNILKEYSVIIEDCTAIRDYLYHHFLNVYDWYGNNAVETYVKQYAEHEYSLNESKKVVNIIESMSGAELKQYLVKLAQDNVLLGIQILKIRIKICNCLRVLSKLKNSTYSLPRYIIYKRE